MRDILINCLISASDTHSDPAQDPNYHTQGAARHARGGGGRQQQKAGGRRKRENKDLGIMMVGACREERRR